MPENDGKDVAKRSDGTSFEVRLPGFVEDENVGLGDVVKYVTSSLGIRPCGGCNQRAEILNRLASFPRRRRS